VKGLFCVDPGGHTGVAWAIVDERSTLYADAMKERLHGGSTTIEGAERDQIRALYQKWIWFKRLCVQRCCMEPDWIELVFEDFVLRGGQHAGGRDGTAPERIAWGFEGYRMARADSWRKGPKHYAPIVWQSPSAASRFKKRSILENCGAWVIGREHERSAHSHMILRVNKLLDRAQFRN
jgi:hypothetical protein